MLAHSVATRASQTAAVIGAELEMATLVVAGVHEVQVGALENRNDDEAVAEFNAIYERWQHGELDVPLPGGETGNDVLDRYVPATLKVAPFRHGVPYLPSQAFQAVDNKALGKPLTYLTAPDPHYAGTATQLVDGVIGGDNFNDGLWVGWRGNDLDVYDVWSEERAAAGWSDNLYAAAVANYATASKLTSMLGAATGSSTWGGEASTDSSNPMSIFSYL